MIQLFPEGLDVAISNVEQAVLKRAEDEVRKIEEEARAAAEALWERESARLREEHVRRVEATRQEIEGALERELSAIRAENNREILKIKNEIIEVVFRKALDAILNLPDDGYAKWVRARVAGLPEMPGARLAGNERDQALLKEAATGRSDLSVADEPAPLKGGFLVLGAQADLDFSIEALMAALRESLTQDVAARLFGKAEG